MQLHNIPEKNINVIKRLRVISAVLSLFPTVNNEESSDRDQD
jgi:hypothetical protein